MKKASHRVSGGRGTPSTEDAAGLAKQGPRIGIIGAGPSGIAAGKNLIAEGLTNLVIFERNAAVGGNWIYNPEASHSSIYETTSAISSRRLSQYDGYPMPADYPHYPSHDQLRRYFQGYADHFGVTPFIRFNTEVVRAAQAGEHGWLIETLGPAGVGIERCDYLLVANGHHWEPRLPAFSGSFTGRFLHSHEYKKAAPFAGKRVLIVGGGNTACDIALETAKVSDRTCLSMRRGYYFFPKFILGSPTDVVYQYLRILPRPLPQNLAKLYLWVIQGRNQSHGLQPPDHEPLEHHPNLNSHIFGAIRDGLIHPRADVTGFDGRQAHFVGGGREEFDVVIAATGYRVSFPFFERAVDELKDADRPQLYLFVFPPSRPDLYFIGLVQPIGCIWPLSDLQARLVAQEILGRWRRPPDIEARIRRQAERPHYSWAQSPRHSIEVDYHLYRKQLATELDANR
jgi:hypothetical protein